MSAGGGGSGDDGLVRSLQAAVAAAQRQQQHAAATAAAPLTPQHAALLGALQDGVSKALSVEEPRLLARAAALAPLDELRREAASTVALNRQLGAAGAAGAAVAGSSGPDDLLVVGLLRWFKQEFFRWVDAPPCGACGGATAATGMVAPTADEAAHGASRVEGYRCGACGAAERFPRYTQPGRLLETRRGRCGEWAHAFLLFLRAAGLDARHVNDSADHVWNEYYSAHKGRWVHVDACEAAADTPLLYSGGWGKTYTHVLAAGRDGVADVTRRYVSDHAALARRRSPAVDAWLAATIARMTAQLRRGVADAARRRALAMRDAAEALELMSLEDNGGGGGGGGGAANLPGRQSGAAAWRAARGEAGAAPASGPSARPSTMWRHAPDADLPGPLFAAARRVTGGACRASGENGTAEAAARLFDGRAAPSKWLDFGGGGAGGAAWVEYRLLPAAPSLQTPAGTSPAAPAAAAAKATDGSGSRSGGDAAVVVVSHYDLVSAGDEPARDPCDWVLEALLPPPLRPEAGSGGASTSGGSTASSSAAAAAAAAADGVWHAIDARKGERFARRGQLRSFVIPLAARRPARSWRLRITRAADPAAANSIQLAAWALYAAAPVEEAADGSATSGAAQQDSSGAPPRLYLTPPLLQALPQAAASAAGATLRRVLTNLLPPAAAPGGAASSSSPPRDAKFLRLSAGAAPLAPVLASPPLLAALFEAGFRPVVAADEAVAQRGQPTAGVVRLLASDDGCTADEAARLRGLLALLGDGGSSSSSGGGQDRPTNNE